MALRKGLHMLYKQNALLALVAIVDNQYVPITTKLGFCVMQPERDHVKIKLDNSWHQARNIVSKENLVGR